jgi:heme A synthase
MRIHLHAALTVAATLCLMALGSVVHGTGASLACPDWPLCHGTAFPEMRGGVELEHSHRLVAAGVVVLIVALFVRTLRRRDRAARALAGAGCALVVVQAALGAVTVLLRLPPIVSIAHLATSMAFLSVVVVLATRLWPRRDGTPAAGGPAWLAAGGIVFVQVVLGAAVRHTGAALACVDIPLCRPGDGLPADALGRLHMLHRAIALLALVVVCRASVVAAARSRSRGPRVLSLAPAIVCAVQIALGIAVVLTYAPLAVVTLHHACGALLLASVVLAYARTRGAPSALEQVAAAQHDPRRAAAGGAGVLEPSEGAAHGLVARSEERGEIALL